MQEIKIYPFRNITARITRMREASKDVLLLWLAMWLLLWPSQLLDSILLLALRLLLLSWLPLPSWPAYTRQEPKYFVQNTRYLQPLIFVQLRKSGRFVPKYFHHLLYPRDVGHGQTDGVVV